MRPTPVVSKPIWKQGKQPFNMTVAIPRMSWRLQNLFNIWQRTNPSSPVAKDLVFTTRTKSLFQQRWIAKRFLKGYHSHTIPTKKFEKWYLPNRIPSIHVKQPTNPDLVNMVEGKERAGGRTREERFVKDKSLMATAPTGSMLFLNVERRLDVCVFRACFAQSIYEARLFVLKGHVKLNGQTMRNTNILLNPGDIFTVNPKIIPFLRKPVVKSSVQSETSEAEAVEEEVAESTEESSKASTGSAEAPESTEASEPAEASSTPSTETPTPASTPAVEVKEEDNWFTLPPYAQASIFVPAYLLPNFQICSAVYVRHPTARAGYSEIATPYDAGGELMALAWEWYSQKAPRMRTRFSRWNNPQRSHERLQIPKAADEWQKKLEERSVITQTAQTGLGRKSQKHLDRGSVRHKKKEARV